MIDVKIKEKSGNVNNTLHMNPYYTFTVNGKIYRELMKLLKEHKPGLYKQFKKGVDLDYINLIKTKSSDYKKWSD